MKKYLLPLLIFMFAAGFLVRLYRFDAPVADWHSFRQSDTNAVSVIYAREGINLLYPKYFDISHVQSGKDNPQGYRMVEFPIYNAFVAVFSKVGLLTIEQWGRLISIFATLMSAYFVYLLTRKYASITAGFFAAFFYLFLPFSIFYGRTILPDPSMAASILAGIYFFDRWISRKGKEKLNIDFGLAILFTSLSLLLKPYALFFVLPMVWLSWQKYGKKIFRNWQLYIFAIVSLLPLILWRIWVSQHPEGIPHSMWLLNGNGIRFRPSFIRWIFYERVTRLILGFIGIVFIIPGLIWAIKGLKKEGGFFLSFAASSLLYLFVIATGNVQHDYYQILIIPTVSIFAGLGASFIISKCRGNLFLQLQVVVLAIVTIFASWIFVKDYFNIQDWNMVVAAREADKILPSDAIVIAPYDTSSTFLNLIKRRGYPVFQERIEGMIKKGANYLVITNPTQSDFSGFGQQYIPVASSSSHLILKLK